MDLSSIDLECYQTQAHFLAQSKSLGFSDSSERLHLPIYLITFGLYLLCMGSTVV